MQGLGNQRDQGTQPRSHSSWRQRVNPGVCVPQAHIHTQPMRLYLAPTLFFNSIPALAWLLDHRPQGSLGSWVPTGPCPITRAQHPLGCTASPGDAAGTGPSLGGRVPVWGMKHDQSQLQHRCGRQGVRLPPCHHCPPPRLVHPRSKASCPRYTWGGHAQAMGQSPCPVLGSSCPHNGGPGRRDRGRKPLFFPVCLCAGGGNMSPGEETSPWGTHGGKRMAEVLADAGRAPSRAAPHQPLGPRTPTQAPIPSPGGCRFVPWQRTKRAGGSVPGHCMAGLSSSSMPPGLTSLARLGRAPKALMPAENASDASEAAWGER